MSALQNHRDIVTMKGQPTCLLYWIMFAMRESNHPNSPLFLRFESAFITLERLKLYYSTRLYQVWHACMSGCSTRLYQVWHACESGCSEYCQLWTDASTSVWTLCWQSLADVACHLPCRLRSCWGTTKVRWWPAHLQRYEQGWQCSALPSVRTRHVVRLSHRVTGDCVCVWRLGLETLTELQSDWCACVCVCVCVCVKVRVRVTGVERVIDTVTGDCVCVCVCVWRRSLMMVKVTWLVSRRCLSSGQKTAQEDGRSLNCQVVDVHPRTVTDTIRFDLTLTLTLDANPGTCFTTTDTNSSDYCDIELLADLNGSNCYQILYFGASGPITSFVIHLNSEQLP